MALIIEIKAVPQSGRKKLMLDKSGILKCFITAAPEDGKANKEIIDFLATSCNIPKKSIEIIAGLTSRKKKIAINTTMTYEQFLQKFGIGSQKTIF
ncbi:DUF167 domain-containing protein [Candidatus Babeliales bacterium]|nr:DUF167 domain-containing protein [Candidatus Babeliales bacterium]